ncbi:MAG TPA: GNAT family N-acetyltransferase [Thermomicrobiales bacterium]|nr:GNAT family N-acetyltransferase [Thermomicrobiales bacterium]
MSDPPVAQQESRQPATGITIELITRRRIGEAGDVIARSLLVEPGLRALLEDEQARYRMMKPLMTGTVRNAARHNSCYVALQAGKVVGVAVWLPPGAFPFDNRTNLRMIPALRGFIGLGRATMNQFAEMEMNAEKHFPQEPVWYLQALGVAPGFQGKGIGSQLIVPALERADREQLPCYLETGTEANVRFYKRAGFAVREAGIHLAPLEDGPTHWTMMRPRPKP